jgi:hypothetical protein
MDSEFKDFIKGKNITTFQEFSNEIKSCELTSKKKGDYFEVFCYYYFKFSNNHKVNDCKFYNEIDDDLKKELRLPPRDKGVDIIIKFDYNWIPIQVKWRNNTNTTIPFKDVSTFLAPIGINFDNGIFFTNCERVCKELLTNNKILIKKNNNLMECNEDFWNLMYNDMSTSQNSLSIDIMNELTECLDPKIIETKENIEETFDFLMDYQPDTNEQDIVKLAQNIIKEDEDILH